MSQARTWQPGDVSAVVCTMNSIASIEPCLQSLKDAGVGEIIVVDASSTDGTRAIADQLADTVLTDPGTGLGNARNVGIAQTSKPLILNMGSDNVLPPDQLDWSLRRKAQSFLHPTRADLVAPLRHLHASEALIAFPFLLSFSTMRYAAWVQKAAKRIGASPN